MIVDRLHRRRLPSCIAMLMADCAASLLLSADEERSLTGAVRAGDESARDRLTRSNVPLVISIARRFAHTGGDFAHAGRDFGDIVGYGLVGLALAVDQYDPARGTRFGTYAYKRILVEIMRGVALDDTWPIRLPVRHAQAFMRLRQSWSVSGPVSVPASKRWAAAFRAACAAAQSFGITDSEWEDGRAGPEWEAILREETEKNRPVQYVIAAPDPRVTGNGVIAYITVIGDDVVLTSRPEKARKFTGLGDLHEFIAGRPDAFRNLEVYEAEYRGDGVTVPVKVDRA